MSEKEITNNDLTKDQIWSLISPLKKSAWYDRTRLNQIKTSSDWGDLWKALCYIGMVYDLRFKKRYNLSSLILEKDFGALNHVWQMTRGQMQSRSYRYNRIEENAHRFTNHWSHDNYPFKLDFIFSVNKSKRYEELKIGYVIASNPLDAETMAKMFYAPFFSNDPDCQIHTSSEYSVPIIDGNKDVYFQLMSGCLKTTIDRKNNLYINITEIKQKIEQISLIEDCINLNFFSFLSNND